MSKKSKAVTSEIKALLSTQQPVKPEDIKTEVVKVLLSAQQLVKSEAVKAEKVQLEKCDTALHALAQAMLKSEVGYSKAVNGVFLSFADYVRAALPIVARLPAHAASLADIKLVFGEARKSTAIQRVTMLNNIRGIAYGRLATNTTPAMPAQGVTVILDALNACSTMPALRDALALLKPFKHGSTGQTRLPGASDVKPPKTSLAPPLVEPVTASTMPVPGTRLEAIKAACRILEFVSTTFLSAGSDSDLVLEVADVVEKLRAKMA